MYWAYVEASSIFRIQGSVTISIKGTPALLKSTREIFFSCINLAASSSICVCVNETVN